MKRLWNLLRGFLNLFVGGIENDHPEIVYDNAIEKQTANFVKLRGTAAAVIRRSNDLDEKYHESLKLQAQLTSQLDAAAKLPADQVDMDAAAYLTSQLDELNQAIVDMKADWEEAEKDEKDVREALLEVQANVAKLKAEKDRQVARFRSSNSRIEIREQLDGLSVNAEIKALDGVRNNIKNRVSEAKLAQDLASNSLESKLKKFTQITSTSSAMDAFKKRQALAHAVPSAKTL